MTLVVWIVYIFVKIKNVWDEGIKVVGLVAINLDVVCMHAQDLLVHKVVLQ